MVLFSSKVRTYWDNKVVLSLFLTIPPSIAKSNIFMKVEKLKITVRSTLNPYSAFPTITICNIARMFLAPPTLSSHQYAKVDE